MPPRVVLVGMPGVGKSTVGAELARRLGVPFVDTDDVVAEMTGTPAATLLRDGGEASFRRAEAAAVAAALRGDAAAVIATGGGAVETASSRALLCDEATVVHLVAPIDVLVARLVGGDRPLLGAPDVDALRAVEARRAAWYAEVADDVVDAAGTVAEVVERIAVVVVAA